VQIDFKFLLLRHIDNKSIITPASVVALTIGDFLTCDEMQQLQSSFIHTLELTTPCLVTQSVSFNSSVLTTNKAMCLVYNRGSVEGEPLFCVVERICCVFDK
jgi:hypothetical protein